ncbi:MAG: hypothetical protein ACE15C_19605 [Phycisphaerae bacterium]
MRTVVATVLAFGLVGAYGCTSPQGGGPGTDEGFKIAVPLLPTSIKQGEVKDVSVSLQRGKYFKQDVKVDISASKGISVAPSEVTVKAEDKPQVPFRVTVPKDAALGEYLIYMKGTPQTGQPTSMNMKVKVVAP